MNTNVLYYGDNLEVLRQHIPDDSVDLIYLDPTFNSNRSYNVLFRESSGAASEAQIEAFEDSWHWADAAAHAYEEVVTGPHQQVANMLEAMVKGLGRNDVTAYLTMMAVRLVELHRVLKPTGSLYLHCDPTAGPYLRVIMDAVFGPANFRSEIVWRRTNAHNKLSKQFGPIHDLILYYSRSDNATFHPGRRPYLKEYVQERFPYQDERGYFQSNVITGAGVRAGDSGKLWHTYNPTQKGRHWALPNKLVALLGDKAPGLTIQETLDALDTKGLILHPAAPDGLPRYKQYLDSSEGILHQDIWGFQPGTRGLLSGTDEGIDEDVKWLDSEDERLGYPTQKPLALLERIVSASSNPGDIVLDPFCGCGTAVHAAQKLGRRWVGMDITYLAINLIERRMRDAFPGIAIEEIGAPVDLAGAQALAAHDKYQFQWWALSKLDAQPVAGKRKGADRGIDGVIPFFAGPKEDYKRAIVSVKGGEHVGVAMVRDLVGVLEREKEPVGILLTLEPPTQPMITEAASAGFYDSDFWKKAYPRVQILTIEDMLAGKRPDLPTTRSPFAQAPLEREQSKQGELLP